MRFTAILLIAMISFQAVQAVSLRKNDEAMKTSYAIERLRFIGKKSTVAHEIVSAVELHLTSGGKVDEVIELVKQALDDVSNRRQSLQTEYNARKSDLEAVINQAETDLENANQRLGVVDNEINRLSAEVQQWSERIENLVHELQSLDEREVQVNNAREIDVKTYEARRQRDQNALDVLEQIVQKLKGLQQRGNAFLQVSMKEIQRALNRIPKSNPIQALVQLSTKFDPERLAYVVEKLEQIQNAIKQSSNEDNNGEVRSHEHYNALIDEINNLRAEKQQEKSEAEAAKSAAEVEQHGYEAERENLNQLIANVTELLTNSQAELVSVIASYEARIADANQAVQAIQAALEILVQNQSELQDRENASDTFNQEQ